MIVSEQTVQFLIGGIVIVAHLIEGHYPKWRSVIPQTDGVEPAIVKCGTLLTAFERAKNATVPHDYKDNFQKGVRLILESGKLTLRVGKRESVKMETSIPVTYNGASTKMYIDPKFLTGLLKALDKDVKLSIYPGCNSEYPAHGSEEPVSFCADDGYTYIVMPMTDDDRTPEEQAEYEAEKERKKEALAAEYEARQESAAVEADEDEWEDETEDDDMPAEMDEDGAESEEADEDEPMEETADGRPQTAADGDEGDEADVVTTWASDVPDSYPAEPVNDKAATAIPSKPVNGKTVTILRESGEKINGVIVPGKAKKGFLAFADPYGKTYNIPARCCTWTRMGQIAYIVLTDDDLTFDTSLLGIFASGFAI